MKVYGGAGYLYTLLSSVLHGYGWPASRPVPFTLETWVDPRTDPDAVKRKKTVLLLAIEPRFPCRPPLTLVTIPDELSLLLNNDTNNRVISNSNVQGVRKSIISVTKVGRKADEPRFCTYREQHPDEGQQHSSTQQLYEHHGPYCLIQELGVPARQRPLDWRHLNSRSTDA
jgi:hypothetical protein